MVVGALLLSSPLLAMLAITYDPGTRVSASDGEDTAMLAKAARYDRRLLEDGGSTAVGEAADPFSGTDAPAWRSDGDYLGQLGAGGRTVAWRVDRRYTVDPGSKAERRALKADGGHTLLTLYTCDPPGLNTRRLVVRAHRVPYDDAARTAERQVDVKGMAAWLGIATILTLTLMTALHPTAQIMRHSSRREGAC